MSGLELYILFAFSVGFWACYELLATALNGLKSPDFLKDNKFYGYLVMFGTSVIFAPLFVVLILIPSLNRAVVRGLQGKQ